MFFQPNTNFYELGQMLNPGNDDFPVLSTASDKEPVKVAPIVETPPIYDTSQFPPSQTAPVSVEAPAPQPPIYTLDQLPVKTAPVPQIGANPPFYVPANYLPPPQETTKTTTTEEEETLYFGLTGKQIAFGGGVLGLLAYFASKGK